MITCENGSGGSSGVMLLPASTSSKCSVVIGIGSGTGSGSNDGSGGGGGGGGGGSGGGGGCTELAVSTISNNTSSGRSSSGGHDHHGGPSSSSSTKNNSNNAPSGFVLHRTLPSSDSQMVNLPQAFAPDSSDPLSFFLASGKSDGDPLSFGVGSVADGTFGGRKPTREELLLFRSHRLLQAEAVLVATGLSYSASPATRQRFGLISTTLARQVRMQVLDQTNAAVACVRALGGCASAVQQQEIINIERRTCHRLLVGILDNAASSLRILAGNSSTRSNTNGSCVAPAGSGMDSGFGIDVGRSGQRQSFPSSMSLMGSPLSTEPLQLSSAWEDVTPSPNTTSTSMPMRSMQQQQMPPSPQQQQHLHQSIMHMPPGMGRSSVFALTQMRDHSQHHNASSGASAGGFVNSFNTDSSSRQSVDGCMSGGLGQFSGKTIVGAMQGAGGGGGFDSGGSAVSLNHGGVMSAQSSMPFDNWNVTGGEVGRGGGGGGKQVISSSGRNLKANKKSSRVLTKMGAGSSSLRRPVYNNRKGSRHRLTPQAKEILESWLAKHWLNPYPTEDEKIYLAQACLITVTQVNNWMMNVRVRRCRTKKIGVATGPEQITYPPTAPKAILANKADEKPISQARLALTLPSSFRGAMVPRQDGGGGGRPTGVLGSRLLLNGETGSCARGAHSSSSTLRIDQPPLREEQSAPHIDQCTSILCIGPTAPGNDQPTLLDRSASPTDQSSSRTDQSSPIVNSSSIQTGKSAPQREQSKFRINQKSSPASSLTGVTSSVPSLPSVPSAPWHMKQGLPHREQMTPAV